MDKTENKEVDSKEAMSKDKEMKKLIWTIK